MAREDFFDSLRMADGMFAPMKMIWPDSKVTYFQGDLWLTPSSVEGFDSADFADWPEEERKRLEAEVDAFLEIARKVPPNQPAPKARAKQARKHLEAAMKIVRNRILTEWLEAQEEMIQEAAEAARAKGWYVEKDQMQLEESLLREYHAPSLLMRTWDREMRLLPVARFCAGRQGVVDLMVSPPYERAYMVTFKDGRWHIVSLQGKQNARPFNRKTFTNTISRLTQF
jgi:hypothetical protein